MADQPTESMSHAIHTLPEALDVLTRLAGPLLEESVSVRHAQGRFLIRDAAGADEIPGRSVALEAGWAVAGTGPWVICEPGRRLSAHQATAVAAFEVLPPGTRAVLRDAEAEITLDGEGLAVIQPLGGVRPGTPRNGELIRSRGSAGALHEVMLESGRTLSAVDVLSLEAAGVTDVMVRPLARVAVAGGVAGAGETLGPLLRELGGSVVATFRFPDDDQGWRTVLEEEAEGLADPADVLLAFGAPDAVLGALQELKWTPEVSRIAVSGLDDAVIAGLPDGRILLVLPPLLPESLLGIAVLVAPLLALLTGAASDARDAVRAESIPLGVTLGPYEGRPRIFPGRSTLGMMTVAPPDRLRSWTTATSLVLVPPHGAGMGEEVEVLQCPWGQAHDAGQEASVVAVTNAGIREREQRRKERSRRALDPAEWAAQDWDSLKAGPERE